MRRILLVGGGTGGHIFPLVAIAQELQKQALESDIDIDVRFMGAGVLLKEQVNQLDLPMYSVMASKWRRYLSFGNLLDLIKFPFAFVQVFIKIWMIMPDVIFSKGGYAGFLPVFCGRLLNIPIYIHESDVLPGKTNKWLESFATIVFTSFEATAQYYKKSEVRLVGTPIRKDVTKIYDKIEALKSFGLNSTKPTIFITGANQGAKNINDILLLLLVELLADYQIIHQCGDAHYKMLKKKVDGIIKEESQMAEIIKNDYILKATMSADEMARAYSASDVVVTRSNSGVHELALLGKASILIPLSTSAQNHQLYNAIELQKHGAIMIKEDNLTPEILQNEIDIAYKNRVEMATKIRNFGRGNASSEIVKILLN